MKIISNEKLINRNKQIGKWTSILAMMILGLGMYLSFQSPELVSYSFLSLLVGFPLVQVGMYLGNRYGRSPRPDEKLDAGLKGLPGEYTIYHYSSPAAHLLAGPAGLWVLMPYHQRGKISYKNNRWRMGGGGFMQWYMGILGQESIGRPDLETDNEIRAVKKSLTRQIDPSELPEIRAALVFTSEAIEIDADDAPIPALKLKQLKEYLRQKAKERPIGPLLLERIKEILAS